MSLERRRAREPGIGQIMDPLTALGKLGAGAVSGPLKNLLAKRSLRYRVSRASSRTAKEKGIRVSRRAIHLWLSRSDVQLQLSTGTSTSIESAVRALAWRLEGDETQREKDAAVVLRLVLQEYLRAHRTQDAIVLKGDWTDSKIESETEEIRSTVTEQTEIILEALERSEVFERDLAKLHPWRRQEAMELAQMWPAFRRFAHTLCNADSPGSVLDQWASNQPSDFMEASSEVWCWFGVVASDYGKHEASNKFIFCGIEAGAPQSNYWWARTALNFTGVEDGREQALEAIERSQPIHPLGSALKLILDDNFLAAETALRAWSPTTANDATIQKLLLSQCALEQEDLNRAIAIALEACADDPEASGPKLRAAEMLLKRGLYGVSDNSLADFASAHTLAIKARDERRTWGGDSVTAILVAVKASVLGSETDQAWRLIQGPPDGLATLNEARDPRLRRETATLAACMNNFDLALKIATEIEDPYITAWVRAFSAHSEGNDASAESQWMTAWALASDDYERLQAANALAPIGGAMPDLTNLELRHAQAVERIKTIHRVMSAPGDRLTILRARAHEEEILTVLLAEQLSTVGQFSEAAMALESGALRWNSPFLQKMAAGRYLHAGDYAKVVEATQIALSIAGTNWEGELDVLRLRLDALEAQGLHLESLIAVRRMIMIAPENQSVRWALIHCLVRSGDSTGAWSALTGLGEPIEPRDIQDARVWISVSSKHDKSPQFVRRSLEIMRRFPDDADFLGGVLAEIYFGLTNNHGEVSETDLKELHAATASFTEAHPKSTTYRAIKVGPDENPLAALDKELGNRAGAAQLAELEQQIRDGELPLGFASEVAGRRSYTELSIQRGSGLVYSHNPAHSAASSLAAAAVFGRSVAIDITAVVALAQLDPELRHQIIGVFASLESTDASFRDALRAQQMLSLRSTMSVNWNEDQQRSMPSVISDDEADRAAKYADRTVEILRVCRRNNWAAPRHLTEWGLRGAWISTLDYAIDSQATFWCDDVMLRLIALERGHESFGTVDLLRELVRTERLQPELGLVAEATLLTNFHVDLGFNLKVMRLGAELTNWEGGGVAAALARPSSWDTPRTVIEFLHEALSKVVNTSPSSVQTWVHCAATGVTKIVEDADQASSNLRLLLREMFPQPWMRPDVLPFIIRGIRTARQSDVKILADDPLEPVLREMHQKLIEEHSPAAAAEYLLMWVRHLDTADRQAAARIVLTSA